MNRLVVLGIVVVAAIYVFFSSVYVVNEREQAIVLRFGQITEVQTEPGLYFKIPTSVIDSVQIIEDRLLRFDIGDVRLQVSDGQFYLVDAFLTYRIVNPQLFRERAQGELLIAEQRIATRFESALRQVYGLREFNAALSAERPAMMIEARDQIRPDIAELGIEIVDVRIVRTDLTPEVSERTYERMQAERLAEAAFLRARGQEAAQSLRAIADRQGVEIIAASRRDSEILRGEGDGERNRIFASAYNADPEFFDFYRSLQSYRAALGSTGTTMVLSPNSEFFRYFGTNPLPEATVQAGGAPASTQAIPELIQEPVGDVPLDLTPSLVTAPETATPTPVESGTQPASEPEASPSLDAPTVAPEATAVPVDPATTVVAQ